MRRVLLTLSLMGALSAEAQGVPTVDATAIGNLAAQLGHMVEDAATQIDQLAALRDQIETELDQLLTLEAQLDALIDAAGVGGLYAAYEDFVQVRSSILDLHDAAMSVMSFDLDGLFEDLSDFDAETVLRQALESGGFDETAITGLGSSPSPQDRSVARRAATGAMLTVAATESHAETAASLRRLEEMVALIDAQDGLRAAVDLNSRITAEVGIILLQAIQLQAAQGYAAGQFGVLAASDMAAQRRVADMTLAPR
ncbi:MAG: type IV secretion system protein [Pseudomonadota bacterium]